MRGKLSARVPRKKRDWHDVLMTMISTDVPEEEIMKMTPLQRKAARAAQVKAGHEEYWRRHRERDAAWLAWAQSKDPNRAPTWRAHCDSIGRMDLHPPHCISRPHGPGHLAADVDYD